MIMGLISVIIGYLLGSMLPAYWIGRFSAGFDIREQGTGNAGTSNVYQVMGLWPAIITGSYDFLKGLGSMGIAYSIGAPLFFIYLSGIMAVIGHIFPFYLRFRGAHGVATSTGLLIYYLLIISIKGWFPLTVFLFLVGYTLILFLIFRRGTIVGLFVLPVLFIVILFISHSTYLNIFTGLVISHIFIINLLSVIQKKPFKLKPETKEAITHLRVILRPLALSFPVLFLFLSKKSLLILIGCVSLFFIALDLIRLLSHRVNIYFFKKLKFFFREGEQHTFSSATQFLTSIFLTVLLFEKNIAAMAIVFLIFGDIFAKFSGLQHGQIKIFEKTLEGTVTYFVTSVVIGFLWSYVIPLSPGLIILGALAAAIIELIPLGVSDNFAIPLISASVMRIAQIF